MIEKFIKVRAIELYIEGKKQVDISKRLKVSKQVVNQWIKEYKKEYKKFIEGYNNLIS